MNTLKELDLYAASALRGLLHYGNWPSAEELSKESFKIANAMLKEREKHEVSDLQKEINALNNLRASDQQTIKMLEKEQAWQKLTDDTKLIKDDWYWIKGCYAPFVWLVAYFSVGKSAVIKNDLILNKAEIIHIPNPDSK